MTFIPDASVLISYSLASFILFATPGPDMSLFLARTVSGGRAAGIASAMGAVAGTCIHTLAAALGVSALIAASETGFLALKIIGALYLAWLAVDAIRNGSALNIREGEAKAKPDLVRTFFLGASVNLANPKVVLFFITFLPQFVAANDPDASGKLMFLGFWFVAMSIPLSILMILGAERVIGALKGRPRLMRAIDWSFAGIFGAFAVKILATQGR